MKILCFIRKDTNGYTDHLPINKIFEAEVTIFKDTYFLAGIGGVYKKDLIIIKNTIFEII